MVVEMIIDCIADLHGHYPKLEGGDLLIIAGDLTARDEPSEIVEFGLWVSKQKYKRKVVVAGEYDNMIQRTPGIFVGLPEFTFTYLCDSGTEITYYPYLDPPNLDNIGVLYKRKTLKIWGSPWTKKFPGQNPNEMAFTVDTEEELAQKWALIPEDTDILVTHSPSFGNLDITTSGESVGSISLWMHMLSVRPKIHVFGHVHESYGQAKHYNGIHLVNCSIVNERYEPVNKPIRIEL